MTITPKHISKVLFGDPIASRLAGTAMVARCALLFSLLLLLAGCSSSRKPINPGTLIVDVKVWRILEPNFDFVGASTNLGCRLDNAEIIAVMADLREDQGLFGPGVTIRWDNVINDRTDSGLSSRPPDNRSQNANATFGSRLWSFWSSIPTEPWDNQAVNIYFVGNMYVGSPPAIGQNACSTSTLLAATREPGDVDDFVDWAPAIFINDGGGNSDFGFCPNHSVMWLSNSNVLVHEMTHYLARFRNSTFGAPPNHRAYDGGEHVPVGSTNILEEFVMAGTGSFPLILPGGHMLTTIVRTMIRRGRQL